MKTLHEIYQGFDFFCHDQATITLIVCYVLFCEMEKRLAERIEFLPILEIFGVLCGVPSKVRNEFNVERVCSSCVIRSNPLIRGEPSAKKTTEIVSRGYVYRRVYGLICYQPRILLNKFRIFLFKKRYAVLAFIFEVKIVISEFRIRRLYGLHLFANGRKAISDFCDLRASRSKPINKTIERFKDAHSRPDSGSSIHHSQL